MKGGNGQTRVLTFRNVVQILAGSRAIFVRPAVRGPSIHPPGQSIWEDCGGRSGAGLVILTNELLGEHDRKLRERARSNGERGWAGGRGNVGSVFYYMTVICSLARSAPETSVSLARLPCDSPSQCDSGCHNGWLRISHSTDFPASELIEMRS